jgi:GH24 family phage-related lysozyme (muramidase)/uncharacterized protein YvpB
MPWINPTQATKLKLRPIDSDQLPPGGWRDRKAGEKLGIVSARKVPGDTKHWEVRFSDGLTIGGEPRKTCFIFADHWEGVGAVYQEAKAAAQTQKFNSLPSASNQVLLPVPYLSQRDNSENPNGSCNVTCFAMMMGYFGIANRTNAAQLEDELYRYMEGNGLSRHNPTDLRSMARAYGLIDDFNPTATIEQVKKHLSSGRPVITHGYFTSFGHIVAIIGYNDKGFIVHDPYGEWTSEGYDRNDPNGNNTKGKQLTYSYGLIERTCLTDNQFWVHFVDREGWTPPAPPTSNQVPETSSHVSPDGFRRFKPQEFRSNSIAAKFIAHFEGLELHQYYCSAGVSTIGLGTTRWHNGEPIPVGATVTKDEAIALFKRDSLEFIREIQRMVDVPLSARQIAALLSFSYNCGWQGLEESSLLKSINNGASIDEVRANFRKWAKAGGEVLPGLLRRRNAEAMLWENRNDWESATYE